LIYPDTLSNSPGHPIKPIGYTQIMPRPVSTTVQILEWKTDLPVDDSAPLNSEPQPIEGEVTAVVKVSSHPGWKISVTYLAVETQLTLVKINVEVNSLNAHRSAVNSVAPPNSLAGALEPSSVTAIGLRSIPLSAIENECRKRLADEIGPLNRSDMFFNLTSLGLGSLEDSDLLYLTTADQYVDVLAKGISRPLETLAVELGRTHSSVRNLLYMARQRGFLTESAPGKAGGHLTNKAKEYLRGTHPETGY